MLRKQRRDGNELNATRRATWGQLTPHRDELSSETDTQYGI